MKLIVILALSLFATAHGLRCYVCSVANTNRSDPCITTVSQGMITQCGTRFCTIRRFETKNSTDLSTEIISFRRACENNPVHLNSFIETESDRTYYRACAMNLCNRGIGTEPSDGNIGMIDGETLVVVPGGGSRAIESSSILIATLMLLHKIK